MTKKNLVIGFNVTKEEYDEINNFFNQHKEYSKGNMMKKYIIDGINNLKKIELEKSTTTEGVSV